MQKPQTHTESPPLMRQGEEIDSLPTREHYEVGTSTGVEEAILRILLYYDIWAHPLTAHEILNFLPCHLPGAAALSEALGSGVAHNRFLESHGYYFAPHRSADVVPARNRKERTAARLWVIARLSMHVIKRFPFVRAVFVSGELSKNVSSPAGDVDFFILTAPGRLWIARTLLVIFKKTVLLNKKKFFCLNYFACTDMLEEDHRNIYVASEVAHLKPLFNRQLFLEYQKANHWVMKFFPNHDPRSFQYPGINEHRSFLQGLLEAPFILLPAGRIDRYLQMIWKRSWLRRYPNVSDEEREQIFTTTNTRSRAYIGNFQSRILSAYRDRLRRYGLESQ